MGFNEKMTNIANEIREMAGINQPLLLDDMVANLDNTNSEIDEQSLLISQIATALEGKAAGGGGGGIILPELNTPATASDILSGKEAINGNGTKITGTIVTKTANDLMVSGATVTVPAGYYANNTSKSVATATQATPTVSIDSNGKITASATQTAGYVSAGTKTGTKQLTAKAATTYTPMVDNQTIAAGTYCSGAQTIKGDSNLIAENIKQGVSIFGINGTYEGDILVANGFPNGQEWTQTNITDRYIKSVYNANGLWVAGGTGSSTSVGGLYYSTDGKTWTQSDTEISSIIQTIHNANGLWVAGGAGFYYSTDGKTWTQSNITSGVTYSIYNANGLWVAGGAGLYYSTDGKTWTQSNITSGTTYSIYNANGIWAAATSTGLYYSTDGKTWIQSNITVGIQSVYNANGLWVSGTRNTEGLYYSTDGKTWTQSNITSGTTYSIYNANGIWAAATSTGTYYSDDGKNWTRSNMPNASCFVIYNANGVWISGSNGLSYSYNGKEWTQSNITSGVTCSIYNANGIWVAGFNKVGLYYSITWQPT